MPRHHPRADAVLHRHVVGEAGHLTALFQLSEGDLQGLRRLRLKRCQLRLRPVRSIRFQRLEDRLHRGAAEQAVEIRANGRQRGRTWINRKACKGGGAFRHDGRLQRRHIRRRRHVGDKTQRGAVRRLDPGARQSEPQPRLPRQARQVPAAADVGKEADPRLRHGEGRALGGDANLAREGKPDAAAHDHSVHHRDARLFIGHQQRVQPILDVEEFPRRPAVRRPAFGQHADVAACAKAPLPRMVDEDGGHGRILPPGRQRLDHRFAHHRGQRMQGARAVQRDPPHLVLDPADHFVRHARKSSREMITRMISLVPSRIWWTRRSRTIRSSG